MFMINSKKEANLYSIIWNNFFFGRLFSLYLNPNLNPKKTRIMKKITLLAIVACAFSLASCKKDYTCECTTTYNGITATGSTTIKDTKKKAKDACEKESTTSSIGGYTSTTDCKIK
jgi:hypothetical protein